MHVARCPAPTRRWRRSGALPTTTNLSRSVPVGDVAWALAGYGGMVAATKLNWQTSNVRVPFIANIQTHPTPQSSVRLIQIPRHLRRVQQPLDLARIDQRPIGL